MEKQLKNRAVNTNEKWIQSAHIWRNKEKQSNERFTIIS